MERFCPFGVTVFLSVFPVTSVSAQIVEVIALDKLISDTRNGISEIISEAEASGTVMGFRIATDANILLKNFEEAANSVQGKTFDGISRTQQEFFSNMHRFATEAKGITDDTLDKTSGIVSSSGAELSRLPLVSEKPLVYSYEPSFVLANQEAYSITFAGSLLSGSNKLVIEGVDCQPSGGTENQLRFVCPAEAMDANEPSWRRGHLSLETKGRWFWSSTLKSEYDVGVFVVPKLLGKYTFDVVQNETVQERRPRTERNGYRNDHCKGGKERVWTYGPAEGCTIDVESASITSRHVSSNSTLDGISSLSSNGFQVRANIRNNGSCGPFGIPKDGRGSVNVEVAWFDICPKNSESILPTIEGELYWTEDMNFVVPQGYKSFTLKVKQEDGRVHIVNQSGAYKWFSSIWDASSRNLIFRPQDVAIAYE